MNNDMIFSPWPIGLFATAILCALLSVLFPRRKVLLSFLTALFSEIGMICGFIMGASLQEILIPFLVLLWINLCTHMRKEGEEQ
jgi:predicted membrane protein